MKKLFYCYGFFIYLLVSCAAIEEKNTSIAIIDNNRHYYPLLTGQDLDISFTIKNTGKAPLILEDIISSCGCIVIHKSSTMKVPPGEHGRINLTFNSRKNIGYVKHWVELYGNFANTDKEELIFDINVVPNALYTKDYEELHLEEKGKKGYIEDLVDGKENNQGYYLSLETE